MRQVPSAWHIPMFGPPCPNVTSGAGGACAAAPVAPSVTFGQRRQHQGYGSHEPPPPGCRPACCTVTSMLHAHPHMSFRSPSVVHGWRPYQDVLGWDVPSLDASDRGVCGWASSWPPPISAAAGTFGSRVRARRQQLGLSQEAAADRCHVHWTFLGQVERGQRNLSLHNILKLAHGLDIDPAELVAGLTPDR